MYGIKNLYPGYVVHSLVNAQTGSLKLKLISSTLKMFLLSSPISKNLSQGNNQRCKDLQRSVSSTGLLKG